MELFSTPLKIFWDSAEMGALDWNYIPNLIETNSNLLCTKDLEFLIALVKNDLSPSAARTLTRCLYIASLKCPSYKTRITNCLGELAKYSKRESTRVKANQYLESMNIRI